MRLLAICRGLTAIVAACTSTPTPLYLVSCSQQDLFFLLLFIFPVFMCTLVYIFYFYLVDNNKDPFWLFFVSRSFGRGHTIKVLCWIISVIDIYSSVCFVSSLHALRKNSFVQLLIFCEAYIYGDGFYSVSHLMRHNNSFSPVSRRRVNKIC